jgi:hypothetical protein
MGIFDFFRKKVEKKEKEKEEVVIEKIPFSEIEEWIEKKIRENEIKEKEVINIINAKIQNLILELNDKIVILSDFDLSKRKEEERVKNIVYSSRDKYIESVENLLEKLGKIDETRLGGFVKKIDKYLLDFNKESFKNLERARYLIGKEIVSINDSLKDFSKSLLEIYNENKYLGDEIKTFLLIQDKLGYLKLIDRDLDEVIGKKLDLDNKLIKKEEEHSDLNKKLEKIKVSEGYLANLKILENIESLKEEYKKDIFELKQLVNFKELSSFFHINLDQLKIVNQHKENFYSQFIEDNGKTLTELLDEAKLNNDKIQYKISEINSKLLEIKNKEAEVKEDETIDLMDKLKQTESDVLSIKFEKSKEDKREDKLKANKEEVMDFLKEELAKLNVEIV